MSASEQEQVSGGDQPTLKPVRLSSRNARLNRRAAPVMPTEAEAGLTAEEAAEARARDESLQRRLGDQDLLRRLRRSGFTGDDYEKLADDLTAYSLPVLRGWMYSGHVFAITAARNYVLKPTEHELECLKRDPDLRGSLAGMTIARALPYFRTHALLNGGWSVDGGASLTTYFTGACAAIFPNEFRQQRRDRTRWSAISTTDDDALLDTSVSSSQDPAVIATGSMWVQEVLNGLKPRHRKVVQLRLYGYTEAEIAEMLDTTERAVEAVMYRFRTAIKKRMGER